MRPAAWQQGRRMHRETIVNCLRGTQSHRRSDGVPKDLAAPATRQHLPLHQHQHLHQHPAAATIHGIAVLTPPGTRLLLDAVAPYNLNGHFTRPHLFRCLLLGALPSAAGCRCRCRCPVSTAVWSVGVVGLAQDSCMPGHGHAVRAS